MPLDALLSVVDALCGLLDDPARRSLSARLSLIAGPEPAQSTHLDVDGVIAALEDDPAALALFWEHSLASAAYDLDQLALVVAASGGGPW